MAAKTDPTELSDEELVVEVINKDKELYVHIVERYQAPLVRYARTLVFELEVAEDVVQTCFIKAYQNLRSFKTDRKFSSWIYRIAHNEAVNHIKKHKREFRPDDETWFDSIADDRASVEDTVDQQLLKELTGEMLAKLESKYREPLSLYFFEGKTYQEISEILRMPTATVGTRINRAKKQLKEVMKEKGVNHEENKTA